MKRLKLAIIVLAMLCTACGGSVKQESDSEVTGTGIESNIDLSDLKSIDMDGVQITHLSDGTYNGDLIVISKSGDYSLTGSLTDGIVLIDIDLGDEIVNLELNNASLSSSYSSPLLINKSDILKQVNIILANGTTNTISNTVAINPIAEIMDSNIDGAIFSREDISFSGEGELIIKSAVNGIVSKGDIDIQLGTYDIEALSGHGIDVKDNLSILKGIITIQAEKDGIHVESDSDKGNITLNSTEITIKANGDGISASGNIEVNKGSYDIMTAEGSTLDFNNHSISNDREEPLIDFNGEFRERNHRFNREGLTFEDSEDGVSARGIKAYGYVYLESGIFTLNTLDDGINTNSDIHITDSIMNIHSDGDGIHSDTGVVIDGVDTDIIILALEGIEGSSIKVSDGSLYIQVTDDGINAVSSNGDAMVEITGGDISIITGFGDTDCIDSNGSIRITGGNIILTAQGMSSIDYDRDIEFTGGTLIINGMEITDVSSIPSNRIGRW